MATGLGNVRQYGLLVLFLFVFVTNVPSKVFDPFLERLYRFVLT